ncbi:hypothetical protein [Haloterrigena alkaliphila]|uniref:hypothetical protein n=1 Tax=Haloterrigena alkaliphila TaxID=2816475 RepID=UPI001CFFE19C|nr:hypothetical protein [Haloterrigena alkaliphila]UHQ95355.1 hypothetical protein J0X25_20270 [Haloterrigena alkaliphila]
MPEDNRFAGLSEAVDEDEPDESADGTGTAATADENSSRGAASGDSEPLASDSAGYTTASGSESGPAGSSDSDESDDPAAFPFDATEKKTVYVRPETLDELEDARALVDAQLRTDHDVRDLTGREFYDAVFRFAASDTAGLIDEILEAREE